MEPDGAGRDMGAYLPLPAPPCPSHPLPAPQGSGQDPLFQEIKEGTEKSCDLLLVLTSTTTAMQTTFYKRK